MEKYDIYHFDLQYQQDFMQSNPRSKIRPCVIKELYDDRIVVMAMITTKQHPNQYTIRDWKEAGLTRPSYINYQVCQSTTKDNLLDYIGHLSEYDIQRIKSQRLDSSLKLEEK